MRTPTPLVSVVIPTHNAARFISETLESVCKQTYTNWEIIVIDDGSTDNTRTVLAPYMDRIRYYFQENSGTAAARNAGLQKARGEFVAFLDHDDIWLPEKLDLQVRALNAWPECALAFTGGKILHESGTLGNSVMLKHLDGWIHEHRTPDPMVIMGSLSREFFFKNQICSASSVLIRRECVETVGGFDERIAISDDYDLWLRISQRYPIVLILSCLYLWRWSEDSQSGPLVGRQHRWTEACITVLEKHWSTAPADTRTALRRQLSRMYWYCGRSYFDQNRFQDSRKMFLGCLRYNRVFLPAMPFLLASQLSPSVIDRLRSIKLQISRGCQRALGTNIRRH